MKKKEIAEKKNWRITECDKVGEVAINYGFTVAIPPKILPEDISKSKPFKDFDYFEDVDEKIALTRWYTDENLISESQPLMIHFKKPLSGSQVRKKPSEDTYGYEIMGGSKATSEAVLVKVALATLSDFGYKNLVIDLNSIGDRESISKFDRELAVFLRKNGHELNTKVRADFKKNPYSLLTNLKDEAEFEKTLPQTIGSLSDLSRTYFKEVLEYVEMFDVPYKILTDLLSNKTYACHTVFEIRDTGSGKDDGKLLAYGYRYNYLAKKMGLKKDVPSVGMTLFIKKSPSNKKVLIKNIKKPRFYLIQLGCTAKLKALNVVEFLRKNKIPVYHSVTKDKIGGQLSGADYMHANHLLIIGQKEAIENTIVVRNADTRVQETVAISNLVEFLKKIK